MVVETVVETVMAVVVKGGLIRLADEIVISRPDAQAGAQQKLMPV